MNEQKYLDELLTKVSGVKEIYQFYIETPFWENIQYSDIKIPIKKTTDIEMIV